MSRRLNHPLRVIESRRMTLVAATAELMTADLAGSEALREAIGADVPENWPPELYESTAMRAALEALRDPAEHGWSISPVLRQLFSDK